MLDAGAVDVLQADATRCGGYTGFLEAAALCDAYGLPLSAHCAPSLHAPVACAASRLVHVEWFHDHVRIERMLLDGFLEPKSGAIAPDRARPGHGYEWKSRDAERFRV
jgi:L-alanine-DL-glutamate epimerase-like enolase superfamily enzyme